MGHSHLKLLLLVLCFHQTDTITPNGLSKLKRSYIVDHEMLRILDQIRTNKTNLHPSPDFVKFDNNDAQSNENHEVDITEIYDGEDGMDLEFPYHLPLNPDYNLRLQWAVDSPREVITFRLTGSIRRDDFIGFGFSSYGDVTNADFMVMWTDREGVHRIQVSCCQ